MPIDEAFFVDFGSTDRSRAVETNNITNDIQRHMHAASSLFPKLAPPVTVTTGVASYVEGIAVDIIPNNTIPVEYDIHAVFADDVSIFDKTFIVTFYNKLNDDNIGEIPIRLNTNVSSINITEMHSGPLAGNTGVYAKVAVEGGLSKTIKIRVSYHRTGAA